jgi:hypothetical protein
MMTQAKHDFFSDEPDSQVIHGDGHQSQANIMQPAINSLMMAKGGVWHNCTTSIQKISLSLHYIYMGLRGWLTEILHPSRNMV